MQEDTGYVRFSNEETGSLKAYGEVLNTFEGIKTSAREIITDIHVRRPFSREDYEHYRPTEVIPKKFKDSVRAVRSIYKNVGIVRNVIDLMTDFACEDMRILHTDKKVEAFFRVWSQKVGLKEAANEFVRHFLIDSNVVVKRVTAKLPASVERDWLEKIVADPDIKIKKGRETLEKREIPWRYTFLNVTSLDWIGGELAKLAGFKKLAFIIPNNLLKRINTLLAKENEKARPEVMKNLPKDIRERLQKIKQLKIVPLDMDKIYVGHNKKSSWESWATPSLLSVLPDIYFKDKLRQADISALDGVINVIRLWKLGDHKEGILPNAAAINKLINILEANTGGGAMDLVWDSMIEMKPFYPPVNEILGSEKYEQVNRDILVGLGVPEVLIGGQGANFSNSFIQLKTLVEKLEYVRNSLDDWLFQEILLVCKAMDIKQLPKIVYGQMNLQDENVTKRLIVGLLDRGVLSVEAVLQAYGEDFLIEVERMKQEKTIFDKSDIEVISPFKKQMLPGQESGSSPGGGRPADTKETDRKQRKAKPRTSAVFAMDAVDAIEKHIVPVYLETIGVENARKLTSEQRDDINRVRTTILACINLRDDISKNSILTIAQSCENPDPAVLKTIHQDIKQFSEENGRKPTLKQRKLIEALSWAKVRGV